MPARGVMSVSRLLAGASAQARENIVEDLEDASPTPRVDLRSSPDQRDSFCWDGAFTPSSKHRLSRCLRRRKQFKTMDMTTSPSSFGNSEMRFVFPISTGNARTFNHLPAFAPARTKLAIASSRAQRQAACARRATEGDARPLPIASSIHRRTDHACMFARASVRRGEKKLCATSILLDSDDAANTNGAPK